MMEKIKAIFKEDLWLRLFLFLFCSFVALDAYWKILDGTYIFSHDSFYWYGIFHYYAESLMDGSFPLWNTFTHSGETFFQNISHLTLLDPTTLLSILIGKLVGAKDLFLLYEVSIIFKHVVLAFGVQLLLVHLCPKLKKYGFVISFVLLMTSFTVNSFHQNGNFQALGYLPFMLLFFLRFLKNATWFNILMLSAAAGFSCQSMHFAYVSAVFLMFVVTVLIFQRNTLKVVFENKMKIAAGAVFWLFLVSPTLALLLYKQDFFSYARLVFNTDADAHLFVTDYDFYKTSLAAWGKFGDFFSLPLMPSAVQLFNRMPTSFLRPFAISELCMFIGFVPSVLAIVGIFKGKSRYKKNFLILLTCCVFLFFGPLQWNIVYRLLFYLFPMLRLIENTHVFANYIIICLLFFSCLGFFELYQWTTRFKLFSKVRVLGLAIVLAVSFMEFSTYFKRSYRQSEDTGGKGTSMFTLKDRQKAFSSDLQRFSAGKFDKDFLPSLQPVDRDFVSSLYEITGKYQVYCLEEEALIKVDKEQFFKTIRKVRIISSMQSVICMSQDNYNQILKNPDLSLSELECLKKLYRLYKISSFKPDTNIVALEKWWRLGDFKSKYVLRSDVTKMDYDRLEKLLGRFVFKDVDTRKKDTISPPDKRLKTMLPDYNSRKLISFKNEPVVLKQLLSDGIHCEKTLNCSYTEHVRETINSAKWMNYHSMIAGVPTAFDFFRNFELDIIRMWPPTALTYPKYYKDILSANISQQQKELLVGADRSLFEFFEKYSYMNASSLLQDMPMEKLEGEIFVHEKLDKQKLLSSGSHKKMELEVLDLSSNSAKVLVTTSKSGFVLFRDGYSSHWKATVNNQEAKVYRANYNSKAVWVDSGKSTVKFYFRPAGYILSLVMYLGAITFLLIYAVVILWRRIANKEQALEHEDNIEQMVRA